MNKHEAHDIFQRARLIYDIIVEDMGISYRKKVAMTALTELMGACQEAMVGHDDTDRHNAEIKKQAKVADGGFLAG